MQLEYEDGDEEDLMLSNEKLKFHVSHDEMERLNLSFSVNNTNDDGYDYDEMVALATSLDDCQELEPRDIIWVKLTARHHKLPAQPHAYLKQSRLLRARPESRQCIVHQIPGASLSTYGQSLLRPISQLRTLGLHLALQADSSTHTSKRSHHTACPPAQRAWPEADSLPYVPRCPCMAQPLLQQLPRPDPTAMQLFSSEPSVFKDPK
ncbi:hypothetical protein CRYUN_Cryun21dG0105900 [Craigia yunnanensis]